MPRVRVSGEPVRDSAAVAEATVNLMEVVYGSPDARLKFENIDEKSDDDDTPSDSPGERESTGEGTVNTC